MHQSTQLLNHNVKELDLKHTDNIIEKFKFSKTSESGLQNFDSLLRVYFELGYISKEFMDSVDLKKFENSLPRTINLEGIESEFVNPNLTEGGILQEYIGVDFSNLTSTELNEQLNHYSPELSQTFSFLGEQIYNFISLYNTLTQGNNFDGFQQYMSLLPNMIGLDPTIPEMKKKQFTSF